MKIRRYQTRPTGRVDATVGITKIVGTKPTSRRVSDSLKVTSMMTSPVMLVLDLLNVDFVTLTVDMNDSLFVGPVASGISVHEHHPNVSW